MDSDRSVNSSALDTTVIAAEDARYRAPRICAVLAAQRLWVLSPTALYNLSAMDYLEIFESMLSKLYPCSFGDTEFERVNSVLQLLANSNLACPINIRKSDFKAPMSLHSQPVCIAALDWICCVVDSIQQEPTLMMADDSFSGLGRMCRESKMTLADHMRRYVEFRNKGKGADLDTTVMEAEHLQQLRNDNQAEIYTAHFTGSDGIESKADFIRGMARLQGRQGELEQKLKDLEKKEAALTMSLAMSFQRQALNEAIPCAKGTPEPVMEKIPESKPLQPASRPLQTLNGGHSSLRSIVDSKSLSGPENEHSDYLETKLMAVLEAETADCLAAKAEYLQMLPALTALVKKLNHLLVLHDVYCPPYFPPPQELDLDRVWIWIQGLATTREILIEDLEAQEAAEEPDPSFGAQYQAWPDTRITDSVSELQVVQRGPDGSDTSSASTPPPAHNCDAATSSSSSHHPSGSHDDALSSSEFCFSFNADEQ